MLYVSHNMNTIRQLCDRCVVLDKGKVVFEGDVEDAIGVYMGQTTSSKLRVDCASMERESICSGKIRMTEIEILDVPEPVIYDETKLRIKIRFHSKKDIQKLMFRVILFSNQHIPVGMSATEDNFGAVTEANCIIVSCDISALAPGEYMGRLVLYEVNEYGGEEIHDVLEPGVMFRKDNIRHVTDTTMVWKSHVWGHVSFPSAEVQNEDG